MTVPGIGPSTAARFVAAIDDIRRFESAHKVEAYLGLCAWRELQLGATTAAQHHQGRALDRAVGAGAGGMVAAGTLPQPGSAARTTLDSRGCKARGKRIATIALARKLAGILYALWRDGTTYELRPQ